MARREHTTEAFTTIGGRTADEDIEPYEAYEDATSYDYGFEEDPGAPAPRVMWGRVALLGAAIVVAFLLGRAAAGGISEDRYQQAVDARESAETELASTQDELAAETERADAAEQDFQDLQDEIAAGAPTDTGGDTGTDTPAAEGKTYVVESGDTFSGIASKFYDDPSLDDFIMEANGISDPLALPVGDEITIPPEPE